MDDGTTIMTPRDRDPVAGLIGRLDGPVAPDAAFAGALRGRLLAELGAPGRNADGEAAMGRGAGVLGSNGAAPVLGGLRVRPARRRFGPVRSALDAVAAAVLVVGVLASSLVAWVLLPGRGERATAPTIARATPGAAVVPGAAMFLGNAARTGEVAGPGPTGKPGLRWRVALASGERNVYPSSPIVANGLVYVPTTVVLVPPGEQDSTDVGFVIAVDAVTGEERWRTEVVRGIYAEVSPPAVVGDLLVVGTSASVDGPTEGLPERPFRPFGDLVALDARSGGERWRVPTGGSGFSSPAMVDGAVFVADADGSVRAVDAATGRERWRTSVTTPEEGRFAAAFPRSLAVADGAVYVVAGLDVLHALDAGSGRERWRFAPEWGVSNQPMVEDGTVYIGSTAYADGEDGAPRTRLHALDAATGAERWTYDDDRGSHNVEIYAAVGAGTLYLGGLGEEDEELVAIDTATGRGRWRYGADGRIEVAPVLVGESLYLTSGDNGLFGSGQTWLGAGTNIDALDVASGDRLWRIEQGVGSGSVPAVGGDAVYAAFLPGYGGETGTLSAYGEG